ncbi:hypothetical protein [Paucibacter sp. Y2R2-4]|uniref:hypothetical protein n=1 Tax=Paucibacter sp. Y2R2-4 TaxID=2893553 RepID=UPI0021E4367B|nr:hypothetical protein [Paucibacter sp. Y2R2-4]MCV2350443.1 hypothetical protein [Paucibacter sp. Y2R2-4]
MLVRTLIYLGFYSTMVGAAHTLKIEYKYDDLKDFIGLLIQIAGMVFTIMGIWIAFLYPNALSRLVNPEKIETADFSETLSETRRLEKIVAAVLMSAAVAVGLSLVIFFKVVLWKTGIYFEHRLAIKSAALAFVGLCTIIQLEAVGSVILANVIFINDLHRKRQDRKAEVDI